MNCTHRIGLSRLALFAGLAALPLAGQQPADADRLGGSPEDSCSLLGAYLVNSPDIAHDPGQDVYLRIWTSGGPPDCYRYVSGTFYDGDGAVLNTVPIHTLWIPYEGGHTTWSGRVAHIRSLGMFVVVWGWSDDWSNSEDLGIAVLDAATQSVTDSKLNAAPGRYLNSYNKIDYHDVGGDSSATGNSALVVFGNQTRLYSRRVTVDVAGIIQLGPTVNLRTSPGSMERRSMARHAGDSGRHLIVFEEVQPGGDADVRALIVDHNDQVIDDGPIAGSAANEVRPHVDGDGDNWLVAYRNRDAGTIECVRVTWNTALATAWASPPRVVSSATGADWPVVAALGDSYRIGFSAAAGGAIVSVDATSCTPCEDPIDLPNAPTSFPLTMTVLPGSPGETLAVYPVFGGGSPLREFSVLDGFTTDVGGGCGAGGRARAHCAVPGNQAFELGLTDAAANTPTFVALSAGRLDIPCAGGCTLIPDLTAAVVLAVGSTDIVGTAAIQAPLPNQPALVGGVLYEQWLLFTGSGCFGAFALSNGLRVELQ